MAMDDSIDDTTTAAKLGSSATGTVRPCVRRCLFERPDADTMRHDLQRLWAELQLNSTDMWNFDFDRQRPVAGPIVWTRDGDMWLGKIPVDSETQCENTASSVTSTQHAVRDHTRRRTADHVHIARVKSSRLAHRRRQSRVTGWYCC